jgi:CarD family transcriptional regulator
VLVPAANAQEMGIRKPVSEDSVEQIFDFMEKGLVDVMSNWKGRYKEHQNLMKTGSILDMALVLKSLYYLNLTKPLSFREKKMMEKAKELIVLEISEVVDTSSTQIEEKILDTLSRCFEKISARVDS